MSITIDKFGFNKSARILNQEEQDRIAAIAPPLDPEFPYAVIAPPAEIRIKSKVFSTLPPQLPYEGL